MSVSISEIRSFSELKEVPLNKVSKIINVSNLLRCSKIKSVNKNNNSIEINFNIDYINSGLKNYHGSINKNGSNESLEKTLLKVSEIYINKIDIPNNSVSISIKL